jgi:hypothetical protein
MKPTVSRWSQTWLPVLTTSTPAAELVADLLGDAETGGGVLAVDDDEIESEFPPQARHMLDDDVTTRPPNDIAAKEEAHATTAVATGRSPLL